MGVYLCVGQSIHNVNQLDAVGIEQFTSFGAMHDYINTNGSIFVLLGEGWHKNNKVKAEQLACNNALKSLDISSPPPLIEDRGDLSKTLRTVPSK